VSARKAPARRVASVAALLGLIGSGIAALLLADGKAGSALAPGTADLAQRPASTPSVAGASTGLPLLQQAVAACQDMSYRGVQVVLWWGDGDTTTSVVDVWHQSGRATVVQAAGGASSGTVTGPASWAVGYQDPDGILGISPQLLNLLQANYEVVYAGRGTVAGRGALVVEARHPGGGLAARVWLDAATKLPLRREIFAGGARLISVTAFTDLEVGSSGLGGAPAVAAAPWTTQLDAARLTSLRAGGWPLPRQLPGNLVLFAATLTPTRSGKVVGLSYSDGLAVVSLFVQRGELAGAMPGWQQVSLSGRTVYAADPAGQGESSLSWSASGYVYTLIANAPPETVRQVVVALPGSGTPGFWQRIGHGLHRLASWASPLTH
jgi:sigma-E factor negative regulatory protein RseB